MMYHATYLKIYGVFSRYPVQNFENQCNTKGTNTIQKEPV